MSNYNTTESTTLFEKVDEYTKAKEALLKIVGTTSDLADVIICNAIDEINKNIDGLEKEGGMEV